MLLLGRKMPNLHHCYCCGWPYGHRYTGRGEAEERCQLSSQPPVGPVGTTRQRQVPAQPRCGCGVPGTPRDPPRLAVRFHLWLLHTMDWCFRKPRFPAGCPLPLSSPTPGSRSALFSSAPGRIPNLHPPQASMPHPTPSFSADGLTSHFRGKNRYYQAGTTQLPTVPTFPLCPTHSSGPSLKNEALAPEQRLPKPPASTCVLGAQALHASPAPALSVTALSWIPKPPTPLPLPHQQEPLGGPHLILCLDLTTTLTVPPIQGQTWKSSLH